MKAYLKNYRQSPRKVRLVTDLIRGKKIDRALTLLSAAPKRAGLPVKKLLESAIANAGNTAGARRDNLIVKSIRVDDGFTFKRYQPRARGRASLIRKRTSNISVVLAEQPKNAKINSKTKVSKKLTS
jgi:large subunit ribosomal protein L22